MYQLLSCFTIWPAYSVSSMESDFTAINLNPLAIIFSASATVAHQMPGII
jgi:hypothetical protein